MRVAGVVGLALIVGLAFVPVEAGQGRVSPHESITGKVDGAEVTITYGRPSMRGRKVFGALVPYGFIWTPGADEATTLTTTKPIMIRQVLVPPGDYSLWLLPAADEWTLYVNKRADLFHTERRNTREDLGRVFLRPRTLDQPVERLTFAVEPSPSGPGGVIKMTWETTEVSAPFTVVE